MEGFNLTTNVRFHALSVRTTRRMYAKIERMPNLILGNKIKAGDAIIGVNSSGIHSNGYSLARKALLTKYSVKDNIKGIGNLGNALLRPTEIYVKPVLEAVKKCKIHGLAHITGGSFTKLFDQLDLTPFSYNIDSLP